MGRIGWRAAWAAQVGPVVRGARVEHGGARFAPTIRGEVAFEPLQRYTEHVAVVQLRSERAVAEPQPQAVQPIEILRPETGRMGT